MTTPNFNALWNLDIPWFESPNRTRGGWSGVLQYDHPEFGKVFIKKQENYIKRTMARPIHGELTVNYEKNNIALLHKLQIPTLDVCYFEQVEEKDKRRGILVTKSLVGHLPLDVYLKEHRQIDHKALAQKLVKLLTKLHQHRLAHCALYPKHIFIQVDNMELKLIDLEKMRSKPFKVLAMLHDLNKLNRHLYEEVPIKLRLYFLKQYAKAMQWESRYKWIRNLLLKKYRRI